MISFFKLKFVRSPGVAVENIAAISDIRCLPSDECNETHDGCPLATLFQRLQR